MTVYYDFVWRDLFPDERTQFKNGLSLARLVTEWCPAGKSPALLLTADETAAERPIETDEEYVVVVRIRHYLAESQSDAAAAYYAQGLHTRIAQVALLGQIGESPDLLGPFLEEHLTPELLEAWAGVDSERRELLSRLAAQSDGSPASPESIAEALRSMEQIPTEVWEALVDLLPSLLNQESRQVVLDAITADVEGRKATTITLGARIAERIADTRKAVEAYEALLASGAGETALHNFIKQHPWMVGLDYVSVRTKPLVPRGELDFCLERFDGFYDILELKSPQDPIITSGPRASTGVPPTASTYKLGPALANALAQVHVYRDILGADPNLLERLYGLKRARDPRLIIVVGQASALDDECQRVLEQLNLSLHRVEVMPFDVLGARAEGWLRNIEHYLTDGDDYAAR